MGDRLLDAAAIADGFGGEITQMTLPLPPKRPSSGPASPKRQGGRGAVGVFGVCPCVKRINEDAGTASRPAGAFLEPGIGGKASVRTDSRGRGPVTRADGELEDQGGPSGLIRFRGAAGGMGSLSSRPQCRSEGSTRPKSGPFAAPFMRPGGFEPPTRGLEVRRSVH